MLELNQADQLFRIERVSAALFSVEASTSWYRASYQTELRQEELSRWAHGAEQLRQLGAGSHLFDALSNCLRVETAMGKRGDFHVSIHLQNAPDYLNEVRLVFRLDQSVLPEVIAGLQSLAE